MAISIETLNQRGRPKPPRILLYGTSGVGKTTIAAGTPDPVFLWIEDGRGRLDVPGWPTDGVLTSFTEVMEALVVLYTEEHDRKTVVIDSIDWLERLVHEETCRRHSATSIEQIGGGYGKGYKEADSVWSEFLEGLTALRDEKAMTVILVAHATVKRFDNPETEAYDRYKIKLQDRAESRLMEYSDVICFVNYRVSVTKDDPSQRSSRKRAVGGATRVAYFTERPAFVAKNRDGMADSIDLPNQPNAWENPSAVWEPIAKSMSYFNRETSEAKRTRKVA